MKLNGVTKLRKNEIRKATKGRNTKERNLSVRRQGAKPTGRQVSLLPHLSYLPAGRQVRMGESANLRMYEWANPLIYECTKPAWQATVHK
jgi:hypothetical protein